MKLTLPLLGFIGLTGIASAFTVTVTNQTNVSPPDLPIFDNAGNPLASGSVGVGFFGSSTDVTGNSTDFAALLGTFQQFGTTAAFTQGFVPGLVNNVAPPEFDVPIAFGSTADPVGQNIFVVFGNAATLAASNELAVWQGNVLFGTDDAAGNGGAAVSLETGLGTLLLGNSTGPVELGEANVVSFEDGIQLVTIDNAVVPEPSTGILAALAGLALVARRRR